MSTPDGEPIASQQQTIQPRLGAFDLTMIVVSLVIGMGIFRTPPEVAQKAGVPMVYFLAWITGAVVSLIGALTFAEIGSRYPRAGGFYKIFSHCYHPAFAFMVNWITVISNAASTAGVAIMGAEYIYPLLLPGMEHDLAVRIITITTICILYVINFLGIRVSAKMLNGLMLVKISLLVFMIFALFGGPAVAGSTAQAPPPAQDSMWSAFLMCFIPVFFTYGGYQQTMNFGSDVANPSRTMPRAIFAGMGIVLFLYLAVNYSYYRVLGFEKLKTSTTLAADMAGVLMGAAAYRTVAVLMFFSVMAYVNVSVMSNPRVYYAMAEDGVLPPLFRRVNPRTQVQEFALSLFCVFIVATLFFLASFQNILNYVMFFDSISLITAAGAIFILRARSKGIDPPGIFRLKGYPVLPVIYILIYGCVIASVFRTKQEAAINGFYLFVSGLPLFYIIRFLLGKRKSAG
jgi:APA family basic amino acid/polyamine antiporter